MPRRSPVSEEQARNSATSPREELSQTYKRWLDEDVHWIITDEERSAFKQLSGDQERDQFIEAFWRRRDPTPDTTENEYKEEHYRRIVFANEQFASALPGWKTDRGRFYVMYGPAYEIESHASGGTYTSPFGGQTASNLPYEVWRYRYLKSLGRDVILPFADICNCGDYRLTEGGGSRYVPEDHSAGGEAVIVLNHHQPPIRFKDLGELVSHKIDVRLVPFSVRTDFVKATAFTVMAPVSVRVGNRDIKFTNTDGVERGTINIFGRVTSKSGWIVETFEDVVQVDVPREMLPKVIAKDTFYQRMVLLRPGQYGLTIAVRDVNGDRVGTWRRDLQVPEYKQGEMATSSLILADKMGPASPENAPGTGHILVGATYVRPLVPLSEGAPIRIAKDQNINVWMQSTSWA
jgi:GWxTD domain-containing protein